MRHDTLGLYQLLITPYRKRKDMTTRVWDTSVLEKPADFTMNLEIPSSEYDVKNPDGTSPVVSLKVVGSSIQFALSALKEIQGDNGMLDIIATNILGDDYITVVRENPDVLTKAIQEIHTPFATYDVSISTEEGDTLDLELTAPSGLIGYKAFQSMASVQKLSALAANLMPTESEYDDEDEGYHYGEDDDYLDDPYDDED
jgi:hypothetical protein